MEYKVIVDYSCFNVPARVRPKQGNTSNSSRKLYFVISKMHIFQFSKLLSNPSKSIEIVENGTSEIIMEPEKNRNIENHRYVFKPLIKYPEESNSSNFELHRAKHKKSVPMQIIKRQFTSLTPGTIWTH